MSLDCYPLGERRLLGLSEQPMAIDAAYHSDLLITVVDNCRTVVVLDLDQRDRRCGASGPRVGHFQLGPDVVIEQVVYCRTGDYIACVGHKEGQPTLYAVFDWRFSEAPEQQQQQQQQKQQDGAPHIEELNLNETTVPLDELDRGHKLSGIDACQATGNLAASYGDLIVIYRYCPIETQTEAEGGADTTSSWHEITSSPEDLASELDKLLLGGGARARHFKHMVSVKLSIHAARISLVENFLSIMTLDHVQVLKLELLTLQIQSEGQEGCAQQQQQQPAGSNSAGSSGESQATAALVAQARARNNKATATAAVAKPKLLAGAQADKTLGPRTSETEEEEEEEDDATTCSLASDATDGTFGSNQSLATNFSSLLGTEASEGMLGGARHEGHHVAPSSTTEAGDISHHLVGDASSPAQQQQQTASNFDSDMSIITMQNLAQVVSPGNHLATEQNRTTATGQDDSCITWNLNTKKLVKLPSLMHNTSTDLASYHICHPLELLGPASESIACRVSARLYAPDLGQNQLEPVVLLCKQFDFERDPIKLVQLEPLYLSRAHQQRQAGEWQQHLDSRKLAAAGGRQAGSSSSSSVPAAASQQPQLLKSRQHDLLASVSCFVATLANCYIYSLAGKKVTRLQTISFPGLCLDLRADLLNVHLLTPVGLQICSTSLCDATLRYDWSSSAELNLSFLARDRVRALTTRQYLVLVSSSRSSHSNSDELQSDYGGQKAGIDRPWSSQEQQPTTTTGGGGGGSLLEVFKKPSLGELLGRIGHTIQRCQSISVRSNLLTYLHASAQLCLMDLEKGCSEAENEDEQLDEQQQQQLQQETIEKLREIGLLLAKQLLQKKQTNVITNSRIDKAIKHLMDISFCTLGELTQRHLQATPTAASATVGESDNGKNNHQDKDAARESCRQQVAACFALDASVEEDAATAAADADPNRTLESNDTLLEQEDEEDEMAPEDGDLELLKIYLRHSKFNPSILDYLKSLATAATKTRQDEANQEYQVNNNAAIAFERLTGLMFDHNPRLLIKCAQRITAAMGTSTSLSPGCRANLVGRLRQLAELDSTGINRATVLFTLAILYHQSIGCQDHEETGEALEQQQPQQQPQDPLQLCLAALGQIKPQQHLAITMCSNHETLNEPMARLVAAHHPHVFRLFLSQLEKRVSLEVARSFRRLATPTSDTGASGGLSNSGEDNLRQEEEEEVGEEADHQDQEGEEEEDEEEIYERNLELLTEVSPLELADLFCELTSSSRAPPADQDDEMDQEQDAQDPEERQAMRALLKASVNLLESRYILARLSDNSR